MNLIGNLVYKNIQHNIMNKDDLMKKKVSLTNIVQTIKTGKLKIVKTDIRPHDFCIFSDNRLLVADYKDKYLATFDQDFNLIEKIDKINNQTFEPFAISISKSDNFYVLDWERHCLIMTDLNFKFIKSVGSKGSSMDRFCYPFSVVCKDNNLFISDSDNKRVKLYTQDLELVKIYDLDYMPYSMKISDQRMCIISTKEIFLYDLDEFVIIKRTKTEIYRISDINSLIYGFELMKKRLIIYDFQGSLLEEIKIDHFKELITSSKDFALLYFNGKLLIIFKDETVIGCIPIDCKN